MLTLAVLAANAALLCVALGLSASFLVVSLGADVPAWLFTTDASPLVVTVAVSWRWRSGDVVPLGGDAIELAWPAGAALRPADQPPDLPRGWSEDADDAATRALEQREDAGADAVLFGSDSEAARADGAIAVPFVACPVHEATDLGPVVTYAHGTARTAVGDASCYLVPAAAGHIP